MSKASRILVTVISLAIPTLTSAETLRPFHPQAVRLDGGIFKRSMETNLRVLDEIGTERALYAFRVNANLPTGDAKPLGGWGAPEPHGAFPGFYESHYLSAISLAFAQTGDKKLIREINEMVAELGKCQVALGGKFLFASPEEEFAPDRLDGVAWYRMHKLLEGLTTAHRTTGNKQALEISNKLAEWISERMISYGDDFEKVKQTEYGGMTESLENLFEITKNPRHREMAHQWEEREKILEPLFKHEDYNEHANTLLAKMVGAARIAEVEGSEYHRKATENFWDLVCGSGGKTYATGGTSIHEGMPPVGVLAGSQSKMPQETCVSYNLLKVTGSLYRMSGEAKYMDYYERSLFNSILGSQDPDTGWKTYYQPLGANSIKDFRSHLTGCYCCNGTGLENPGRYGEMIYSRSDEGLRVNLFIASTLGWTEKKIRVIQSTRFPEDPHTDLYLEMSQPVETAIAIRRPPWCGEGFSIRVNGKPFPTDAKPGSYVNISRRWNNADRIDVALPMSFSKYRMPDKPSQMAFLCGPVVLVGQGARPHGSELVGEPGDLDSWFKPVSGRPLHFTATDKAGRIIALKPYHKVSSGEYFTGYWDVVEKPTAADETNIALGKHVTCSTPETGGANVEAFMRPEKAVDGQYGGADDFYTKWLPNGISPQWIAVDLGGSHKITGTEWIPAEEDIEARIPYRCKIEFSTDGEKWEIYEDSSENNDFSKYYKHSRSVTASHMRLTTLPFPGLEGNAARPKIAEFRIFGKPE